MKCLAVLVTACLSLHVHAAEPRAAENAYAHFEEGERAFADGRFEDAAVAFGAAFTLHPEPAYLFNRAVALGKAGRYGEAVDALDAFIARFPDSERRAEVERKRAEFSSAREARHAIISVTSIPARGRAELSTGESCETPCALRADPGLVRLTVFAGGRTREQSRSLGPGEHWSVGVDLAPPPPPRIDRTASWVSWGVGAGALVVGAAFAVTAGESHAEGKRLAALSPLDEPDMRRLETLREEVKTRSLVADASFGCAILGITLGTVFWVTADGTQRDEPVGAWRF